LRDGMPTREACGGIVGDADRWKLVVVGIKTGDGGILFQLRIRKARRRYLGIIADMKKPATRRIERQVAGRFVRIEN
jgi:hypothetical protein